MSRRSEYDSITFEPEFDLSIDGKDLSYRDPKNTQTLVDSSDEEYEGNPNAYSMTNALYDYSYGEMRKAGQALGISNVDEPEEVEKMLAYMSKPPAMEKALDEQIEESVEPESTTPKFDELADKDAPLSEELQKSQDFLVETVDAIRDGTYNDSYRRRPSGTGVIGANESYGSQMLDTQIRNATTGINIDNFTKQRNDINQQIEDDYMHKLYTEDRYDSIYA